MKNTKSMKWTWLVVFALLSSMPTFADTVRGGSILQLRPVIPTDPGKATQPGAEKMKMERTISDTGQTYTEVLWIDKTVVIDQNDVQSASVSMSALSNANVPSNPEIEITLTPKGTKRLAEFTRDNLHKRLAIILDGHLVSAPVIHSEIPGGKCGTTGNFTPREAANLSDKINQAAKK
jgi:preprotein translocase subunit SecD